MHSLLVVSHDPSPNMRALSLAVMLGAANEQVGEVEVRALPARQAKAEDVLTAHAVILGTTENFGSMSGALKDFLERIYYPCLHQTRGMPYALYAKGGTDGHGAVSSVQRIATGLGWRPVHPPLVMTGAYRREWQSACEELGMTVAAGLAAGIF